MKFSIWAAGVALTLCPIAAWAQNCAVNAGIDQTICVSQPLTLTGVPGSPQFSPPAYLWTQKFGPAATITTPTATTTTVTGLTPGNYVFELASKCADGLFARNLVNITVRPEAPAALAGPDITICTNTPVALSANTPPIGYTGTWTVSPAGGSFSPNANTPNATYTPPAGSGTYTLTWSFGDGFCTSSDNLFLNVVVPPAMVDAGPDQNLSCSGNSTTLAAVQPGLTPPQSGVWSVVSGPNTPIFSNINARNSTLSNLVVGTYVLRWTVSGPCQTGSDQMTITVTNTFVAPNAGTNQTYNLFCTSPAVTVQTIASSVALATGETGAWTQTSGGLAPYPNVTFLPDNTGSSVTISGMTGSFPYRFTFRKTNAAGCQATSTHTINRLNAVINLSEPVDQELLCDVTSTTFTVQYTNSTAITTGLTRTGVRISGPAAEGTLTYTNSTTSGANRIDTWTIAGVNTPGTYVFRLEYRNVCGSEFRDVAVTVSRTPGAVNAGSDIILPCNTLSANPIGTSTAPGNVVWSQISGPNTATLSNTANLSLNMTNLAQGVYAMRLSLSGGKTCTSKVDTMLVYVTTAAPTTASAGANGSICAGRYQLNGNIPQASEIGTWTVSPSAGVSFSPNANTPNAYVSGLAASTSYEFTWTVANSCGSINSSQTLITTGEAGSPFANAGTDRCLAAGTTSVNLTGSDNSGALILWTALSTGSSLTATTTRNTTANITGGSGTYLFEYQLSSGTCLPFRDTIAVTVNIAPVTMNAGSDISLCAATIPASLVLNGSPANVPAGATGGWQLFSGPSAITFSDPLVGNPTVSGLEPGIYELDYRAQVGVCAAFTDRVVLSVAQEPTNANAGTNINLCDASTSTQIAMAATPVTVGSGFWQAISGPPGTGTPTISSATSPTTNISNLTNGVYTFRWTTANGPACATKTSDITISITARASAGTDLTRCQVSTTNLTGNPNTNGTWTQLTGPAATVTTNSINGAVVTGLTASAPSTTYSFEYALPVVGGCPASKDTVLLTNIPAPSTANAGADIEICGAVNSITLTGNTPAIGTGSWTRVSGPNTPSAGTANGMGVDTILNNIIAGIYVYRYNVTSQAPCLVSSDEVIIVKELPASAGADLRLCNANNFNLTGNVPALNPGSWSVVSGPNTPTIDNPNDPSSGVSNLITGEYLFRWNIAGTGGCDDNSDTLSVSIDPLITGLNAGADSTFCQGAAMAFPIGTTGVGGITYSWTPNTLLTNPNTATPTFTGVDNAGTFTYTVRAFNGSCEAFDDVSILVHPRPNASILIAPGGCAASFTAGYVGAGVNEPITYAWTFGSAGDAIPTTASGAGPHNVAFRNSGNKTIRLDVTSGDGCATSRFDSYNPTCVLPVTLSRFDASWSGRYPVLNWSLHASDNFQRTEIERSVDGQQYQYVGSVVGTTGLRSYQFEDQASIHQSMPVYYRLKFVDGDGRFSYSPVRIVNKQQDPSWRISPNPFREALRIDVPASVQVRGLQLLDMRGQLVLEFNGAAATGNRTLIWRNVEQLPAGTYILRVLLPDSVRQWRIVHE